MAFGINGPQGLVPRSYFNGSLWTESYATRRIAAGYGTNIFTGDIVKLVAGNTIALWTNADVGTTAPLGVFAGWRDMPINDGGFNYPGYEIPVFNYWAAGTQPLSNPNYGLANVIVDPWVIYSIQVSVNGNNVAAVGLTLAQTGQNASINIGGGAFNAVTGPGGLYTPPNNPAAGNTTTGMSAYYLDYASLAENAGLPLILIDLDGNGIPPSQQPYVAGPPTVGVFNNALVLLNTALYKSPALGVAA